METFMTMLHHFLILLVWMYFTHYFLTPKSDGWKKELYMLPVWIVALYISSTALYLHPFLKAFILPIFITATFCFMYEWEPLRFMFAIVLILLIALLSEAFFDVLIIIFEQKGIAELDAMDRLIIMPFDFIFHIIIFRFILHNRIESERVSKEDMTTLFLFLFSQFLLAACVTIIAMFNNDIRMIFLAFFLILAELLLNLRLWKSKNFFLFDLASHRYINKQYNTLYQEELQHYIDMNDQTKIYSKIRHDLLNEITIIQYIEDQESMKEG